MNKRLTFLFTHVTCRHKYPPLQCRIHQSRVLQIDNHYAVLGLKPGAPLPEIKKSFYSLSKTHHPDRNPDNQAEASKKFTAISDAYHVLSDAKQREKYDRELRQEIGPSRPHPYPSGGSGFSPGGRKASGLSRRKGAFRGPPPSFYRSGGWGDATEKRYANMGTEARNSEPRQRQEEFDQQQQQQSSQAGTTGTWSFRHTNDVPHFNREAHLKTQTTVEKQLKKGRRMRRAIFDASDERIDETGIGGRFLQVCGLLAVGIGVPVFLLSRGG